MTQSIVHVALVVREENLWDLPGPTGGTRRGGRGVRLSDTVRGHHRETSWRCR